MQLLLAADLEWAKLVNIKFIGRRVSDVEINISN